MSQVYVHGYSPAEESRLRSQANILVRFIHDKTIFAPGSRVLEPGCGTGAQTASLVTRNPGVSFVSVDHSTESLAIARERVRIACEGLPADAHGSVEFRLADILALPFADGEFDGAFICFVLEHLSAREQALREIRRALRPGARVYAFEGDHGGVLPWPPHPSILALVAAVVRFQCMQGGDPTIGRGLYPILERAEFRNIVVEPCIAYADDSRPDWVAGFTRATFIDMMKLQREFVLEAGLLDEAAWWEGIEALERTASGGGTFSYSFYRATAER